MHKKIALIGIFVSFAFIINLSFVFAQTAPDTTPPTVSISTPPRSTPVSGSILIQAQATDNIKIYGVNFYADGQKINYYEDRYAPFNTYFNTIKFQNGAHEVIAVARDASNNYATSSPFVITASNRKSVAPALTVFPSYAYNGTTTSQIGANITAKLYGTAVGPANYYFYCNSAYSLSASTSTEPDGKYLGVNSNAQIHKCSYPSSGTYYPKVVVERDGAVAQRRSTASIKPPVPVIKFSVGDKIKIGGYTSTKVNVRSEPSLSGAIVGTQTYNSQGAVLEGPIYSRGYWWWRVDFDNGADGWAAGNYLVKVVSQMTQTTIPTQTTAPTTTTTTATTTSVQIPSGVQITAIINVANITPFSATINWMTNHPMDGQVEFGTSPCPCPNGTPVMPALSLNHAVNLSSLVPSTTYYYRVKSKDLNRNLSYTSENQIFTTTVSPNIVDADTDGDGFSDRIEAFVGTDPKVACGANAWPADIDNSKKIDIFDVQSILNKIGGSYVARLDLSANDLINQADVDIVYKYFGKTCAIATPITTTNPTIPSLQISSARVMNISPFSASIDWMTNIPTDSQVEFGASPCPCANSTPVVNMMQVHHVINLSGLTPNTTYHYRAKSKDTNIGVSASFDGTFTTTNSLSVTDTDTDGDGFADRIESFVGTDPAKACGVNAWPADINDDGLIEIGDTILIINKITSTVVPYSKRHDLNANGSVTTADVDIVNKHFGKSCIVATQTANTNIDTDGDSFGLVDDQGRLHFRDEVERFIGTDPAKACGANAWPADINNDGIIEIGDTILISNNSQTNGAVYNKRYDFNMDGATNILDILRLNAYIYKTCSL